MKKNDDLFNLINLMNTGEKGYFKKFSRIHNNGGDNKYLRLFNCISSMKEYDDALIKKEFKGEKVLNQLAVARHYLHESILNALVSYHKDGTEVAKLNHLLALTEIALQKADFNKCRALIEKGKQLALLYERHSHLLCLCSNEITLATKLAAPFAEIEKLYEERARASTLGIIVAEINFYSVQLMTLLNQADYKPNKEQKEKLAVIMARIQSNEIKYQQSFNASAKFLEVSRNYEFFVMGNHGKAFSLSEKSVELYEKHPEKIPLSVWNYTTLLIGNTEFYNNQGANEKSLRSSLLVKETIDKYRRKLGDASYGLLLGGFMRARLSALLLSGNYKEALAHTVQFEKIIAGKQFNFRGSDIRVFLFYAASVRLFVNQPDTAIHICRKLLPQIDKDTNKQMNQLINMIEILAHYQSGSFALLPHLLKSLQRWCKAYYNKTSEGFSIYCAMIRALGLAGDNKTERRNILLKYQNKFLHHFTQHDINSRLLEDYIDINAWIAMELKMPK